MSKPMTREEIIQSVKEGRNLSGADLSEADLSGADLSGADLSGADLRWANLSEANLSGADLSEADLSWADLSGADLSLANLSEANLIRAHGLYSIFAPGLSSRRDALRGHLDIVDGVIVLRFDAGCFTGSADELRTKVAKNHVGTIHEVQYNAAITAIEAFFAADMAAHKWDYLLELNSTVTGVSRE